MVDRLWISELTGTRRRGTTIIELHKAVGNSIKARAICEELVCCSEDASSAEVLAAMKAVDFDAIGVTSRDVGSSVVGYVLASELGNSCLPPSFRSIDPQSTLKIDSTLADLIQSLGVCERIFVTIEEEIVGIVTRADLNKPIARVYLFGMVTLLEIHLAYWAERAYPDDDWMQVLDPRRVTKAKTLHLSTRALQVTDCLQFCDRRELFVSANKRLRIVPDQGRALRSKLRAIEKLRNALAHSQSHISRADDWVSTIQLLSWMSHFLSNSDGKVSEVDENQDRALLSNSSLSGCITLPAPLMVRTLP